METKKEIDVFKLVNDRIISQFDNGVVPWEQLCKEMPRSLVSGKPHRGINAVLLASLGYERNYFLTPKELKEMGGMVKENEKSCPVVYWKWPEGAKKPELRYYSVFNVEQCEGIEDRVPAIVKIAEPLKYCREIVARIKDKPRIVESDVPPLVPSYDLEEDIVSLPKEELYEDKGTYYDRLFRNLIHCTGHPKRLNRQELKDFCADAGVEPFSPEELIAGIGAFILRTIAGIEGGYTDDSPESALGWLKLLQREDRLIVYASAKAQKAVDYILGTKPEAVVKEDQS